jgi:hypothetical protein
MVLPEPLGQLVALCTRGRFELFDRSVVLAFEPLDRAARFRFDLLQLALPVST